MKIKNTRGINEKIMSYIEGRHASSFIATAILLPISTRSVVFSDEKTVLGVADEFLKNAQNDGVEYTRDEAIMAAMLLGLVRKHNVQGGQFPEALYDEITRNSRILHKDSYADDPYRKKIAIRSESVGKLKLAEQTYYPYEMICYNASTCSDFGVMIPSLAAFDCEYHFPCIMEGEKQRYAVSPYEIETTREAAEAAKGHVLVLGLKMGYFTYLAHLKDTVEKVTVIEQDADLIELFRKAILPQFDHPEKVEVIEADPFAYMETVDEASFDYCFADLWMNPTHAEPYFRIKNICRRFSMTKMRYWIEENMIGTGMGLVFVVILEAFYEMIGIQAPVTDGLSGTGNLQLEMMRKALAHEEITRPDHVDWYMDPENILKLLEKAGD